MSLLTWHTERDAVIAALPAAVTPLDASIGQRILERLVRLGDLYDDAFSVDLDVARTAAEAAFAASHVTWASTTTDVHAGANQLVIVLGGATSSYPDQTALLGAIDGLVGSVEDPGDAELLGWYRDGVVAAYRAEPKTVHYTGAALDFVKAQPLFSGITSLKELEEQLAAARLMAARWVSVQ